MRKRVYGNHNNALHFLCKTFRFPFYQNIFILVFAFHACFTGVADDHLLIFRIEHFLAILSSTFNVRGKKKLL